MEGVPLQDREGAGLNPQIPRAASASQVCPRWAAQGPPRLSLGTRGALTGSSDDCLSFSSSSWEGARRSCWTSAWSWARRGSGDGEGGGPALPSPPPRRPLTCTPGARGSRRPGSRNPQGRRPRRRVGTPGPAPSPPSAAGSLPLYGETQTLPIRCRGRPSRRRCSLGTMLWPSLMPWAVCGWGEGTMLADQGAISSLEGLRKI